MAALLAASAGAESLDTTTVELEYRSTDTLASTFGRAPFLVVILHLDPPDKPRAEPISFSHRPRYGSIQLGKGKDTSFLLLLDESHGTGTGYDVLYVDANNNEDLSDDAPLQGQRREVDEGFTFPLVELAVPYGETVLPYHITARTSTARPEVIIVESAGYCEGELRAGESSYRLVLFDNNLNGVYSDAHETAPRFGPSPTKDAFVVDVNRDGAVALSEDNAAETHTVGHHVVLGGDVYAVTPAPNGRSLGVGQPATTCGTLLVNADGFSGELSGQLGIVKVRGKEPTRLPAGEYQFLSSYFDARDAEGQTWRIGRIREFAHEQLTIRPGETTEFAVGPPLEVSVDVGQKTSRSFRFSLKIVGIGSEQYSACDIQAVGGERPAEPSFKVTSRKGRVIGEGQFRYG